MNTKTVLLEYPDNFDNWKVKANESGELAMICPEGCKIRTGDTILASDMKAWIDQHNRTDHSVEVTAQLQP